MRYVIMCAGKGTRWNNHLGVPKHLIEIKGETLLGRTTRLLKENGIDDYVITGNDERYSKYGKLISQSNNDCEIDRFEELDDKEICYLYGDVFYTDRAMKTIVNVDSEDNLFFGSTGEIFAVKVKNKELFFKHKKRVKELFLEGKCEHCIGWQMYRSLNDIDLDTHKIYDNFKLIFDGTDDIDYPKDYENFVKEKEELIDDIHN